MTIQTQQRENQYLDIIKSTVESYEFIKTCLNAEYSPIHHFNTIELTLVSNVPSYTIRTELQEKLSDKFPQQRFAFKFMASS